MPLKLYENKTISSMVRLEQAIKRIKNNQKGIAKIMLQSILSQLPNYSNALYVYSFLLKDSHPQKSTKYKYLAYGLNIYYYNSLGNTPQKIIDNIKGNISAFDFKDIKNLTGARWNNMISRFVREKDYQTSQMMSNVLDSLQKSQDFCGSDDWASLGLTDFAQGRYKQAIQKHLMAVNLKPEQSRLHNNLSTLTYLTGYYTKSLFHIQKTMQLRPNRQKSLYLKSYVRSKQGFKAEALELIEQALSSHPTNTTYKTKMVIQLLSFPEQFSRSKNILCGLIESLKTGFSASAQLKQAQILNFLLKMIEKDPSGKQLVINKKWLKYLECYNDYALAGAKHKLELEKQMNQLKYQLMKDYSIERNAKNEEPDLIIPGFDL